MRVTQSYVQQLFDYNADTGVLLWKVSKAHCIKIGSIAGCHNGNGRLRVLIDRKKYYVHQIIWMYVYGSFVRKLDHKDGNPLNNRIENLRPATDTENGMNRKASKGKEIPIKNVYRHGGSYSVRIVANKHEYTKTFKNFDQAVAHAKEMRQKLHGLFARDV